MSSKKIDKPSPDATVVSKSSSIDIFEKLGKKGIFICSALILLVAFFVFKDFILQKKMFLYKDIGSDTLNGVLPYFAGMADYIHSYGLPRWSWAEGLGQSIFAGFIRDPFQLISYMAGPKALPQLFIYVEVLKIILGGSVFYMFLKTLKVSNFSSTIAALMFSFSGFMIIGACWYIFTYEALSIALLLLSFELLFQKNKWLLFVISVFLVCISMPFNLYVYGLFLAIYAAFRLLLQPEYSTKKLFTLYAKLIALGVAGILLSGPFLLENLVQLIESPRGSGGSSYFQILASKPMFDFPDKWQFGSAMMRMFSSDILGSGSNFMGWNQNFLEAPMSYCGLLSLILMPQIFSFLAKPARRWYIVLVIVWLLPTIFPWFRYAFWLFSGDYYRAYSFFISLVFLIYSAMALDLILKHKKVSITALAISVIVLLTLVSYPYFKGMDINRDGAPDKIVDETVSIFVKIFLVLYAILLFAMSKAKNTLNLKYTFVVLVCIELIYLSGLTVNRRTIVSASEIKEKVGYNDYTLEAVAYLKSIDKSFYRIDKGGYFSGGAIHGSLIDHKIQGYYGTSTYNSFAHPNYINYFRAYGVSKKENEFEARWVPGLIGKPVLETLNHVKYILTKSNFVSNWRFSHDSINKFGDIVVLRSKFQLPFGYTYNQYIKQTDFDKLSVTQKDFVSLVACTMKDEDVSKSNGLKQFQLKDTINPAMFTYDLYKADVDVLKMDSLNLSTFGQNKIEGTINVSENKISSLSMTFDDGWKLFVDGKETEKLYLNNGLTGIALTKGNHKIDMEYSLRYAKKGLILSLFGLLFCGGLFFFFKKFNTVKPVTV